MTSQASTRPHDNPVTVIGLGPMGLALAGALLRNGHPTTVWNRTPGKARDIVARGARLAGSVADAVAAGPLTVVCLKDYATLYEVLDTAGGASAGRTLVNLNSGTPNEAHAAASWAAGRGVAYLDGAVMVPPPLVGDPGSVFLFSGPREVFDTHRAALTSLGDPRYLGSDPGLAVLHNAALLGLMYATMNGFLHATALVGSAGVRAAEFADLAVNRFLPTVVDATLVEQAPDLDAGHYPGELGTLHMNLNALEHITLTCEEQGVHTGQPRLMREIAAQAIEDGHGGSNYLAVFEVFRKAAPGAR
ncbi:NAD(P)-dependent oxidoreductase [Streptomyces cyaneofuscatus]|uniref:NAD(P)-binding domain-containing protein n=1 Tax=Streptomyces cyaneofuscatus TaxID=66883 RepID=A0ABZ1F6S2_9ACTN|nr:NAD(P)-binding domain-containing protein [Streptomyces cyaneofuscatus]WSB11893.1 NAD(P)-binding domain-containing protein [Streptomyces cyaneofuscatus]WSD44574.1 NAD(P)-binding domain-containing protein [Streptomyces cyaneofuscatus]